jgi:Undecaprenyl-phosphate glucose phosphotransferase
MRQRLNFYHFYLRIVAYLLPLAALECVEYAQLLARRFGQSAGVGSPSYGSLVLFTTFVWAITAEYYGVTSVEKLFLERTGIRAAFAACVTTYALILGALFLYRYAGSPPVFFPWSAFILLFMTLSMRAVFRKLVRRHTELRKPNRLLVIGADRFARRVANRLIRAPLSCCRVVGYVSLPGQEIAVDGAPLYLFQEIEKIRRDQGADEIIVAIPPGRFSQIPNLMHVLERFCLPVRAIIDLGDHVLVRERLFQFGRLQMLDLTTTPAESVMYSLLKRAFDVAFSISVILLTAPLMALIALAVRLTSPGPTLFVQDRVGLNGKIFQMYKFRTMRMAAVSESDTRWTTANDPRRTRIGILLRKTSLDELPQFFNVLRGDMSVVGPRPERPQFVEKFLNGVARYNNRHRLKVGITGWAQVNGWRGDTSIRKRVECDLYYLQNWSFTFDLRIIIRTLFVAFRSRNAY